MKKPEGYNNLSPEAKSLVDNLIPKDPPLSQRKWHGFPWRVYHALFKAGYCKPPDKEPISSRWGFMDEEIRRLRPEPDRERILEAMKDGTIVKSKQIGVTSLVIIADWLYPKEE